VGRFSGGEGIHKSNPEIFRRAAAMFGVVPQEAVHIGDDLENDVRPAKEAGLYAIWFKGTAEASNAYFKDMWQYRPETISLADAVVDTLVEIPAAIRGLST
jgi:FMN phosphatase YigB (HAD superfamily)